MKTDINGWNALHYACYNPHTTVEMVNRCLRDVHKSSESSLLSATDGSNDFPCAVAIRHKHYQEIQLALFELYPINKAQLNSTKANDQKQLVDLTIKYLGQIFNAPTKLLNLARQHGWVHLVGELNEGEAVDKCVMFIKEAPIGTVEYLAYCKDNQNRSAMDNATREIQNALKKWIEFVYLGGGKDVPLDVTRVIVDATVTTIGDGAFQDCSLLTSIEFQIPSLVTTICKDAFNGCSSLKTIAIPSSVTTYGKDAFKGCPLRVCPQRLQSDLDKGKDLLDVDEQARALADIIASRDLEPPFVVGILGGWGCGKSFTFNLIKKRLAAIEKLDLSSQGAMHANPFVGHIYTVNFDAWTYAKNCL
jgi:hypothetical protein